MMWFNVKNVESIIETWFFKKQWEIRKEILERVLESAEDQIKNKYVELVDKVKEVIEANDKLKENPIDKQISVVMGAWVTQLNKAFQKHNEDVNAALTKKHDEMVEIVNNLLEKSAQALEQSQKYHAEMQEMIAKATPAPKKAVKKTTKKVSK